VDDGAHLPGLDRHCHVLTRAAAPGGAFIGEGGGDGGVGEQAGGVEGGERRDFRSDKQGYLGAAEGDGVATFRLELLNDADVFRA